MAKNGRKSSRWLARRFAEMDGFEARNLIAMWAMMVRVDVDECEAGERIAGLCEFLLNDEYRTEAGKADAIHAIFEWMAKDFGAELEDVVRALTDRAMRGTAN